MNNYKKNGAIRRPKQNAFISPEIKRILFASLNFNIGLISLIGIYILCWLIKL